MKLTNEIHKKQIKQLEEIKEINLNKKYKR